jgi:hypothetical protein
LHRVHTHTGWRKIAQGQWAYLHGEGCIGADENAHKSLSVRLPPNLKNFVLPVPPQQAELIEAVRCALRFCQLGPSEICAPLFAAVWRSCLDSADFSIFLVGPSGAFKSEIAALAQQFFGADFSARDLPGAWSSTDNALEATAFLLKDALFVIDDFAHAKADRILRAQGNNSARSRMSRERGLHADKPPRGLILATGEDIPQGHSIRARTLLIEASKGAISDKVLTLCQNEARSGAYAKAMSGFLSWLAPRYDEMLAALPGAAMQWRDKATQQHLHRRTPAIIGQLAVGLRTFFDFAQELGVLPASQADEEFAHGWEALQKAAVRHESDQNSSEPTKRFAELLQAALASGQAHVANLSGDEPQMPEGWGWRREPSGSMRTEWKPQGQRIGWTEGGDLFLNLDVAYNVAHRLGEVSGDALALSARTIAKRLNERGWLVTTEQMAGRQTLRVRKTIEGRRMEVLHLRAEIVHEKPDQPDQSSLA